MTEALPAAKARRTGLARAIALVADAVQLLLMPLFAPGFLSPANDVLDLAVGLLMVRLVGWHWAFLPTFVAELVPGFDLMPTWTAAVWFATRRSGEAEGDAGIGAQGDDRD